MKQPEIKLRVFAWLVTAQQAKILDVNYEFQEAQLLTLGLEHYRTQDDTILDWKPVTIFLQLQEKLTTGDVIPGIGDHMWLTGNFSPFWFAPDAHTHAIIAERLRQVLHAIQGRLGAVRVQGYFSHPTWQAHQHEFQRAMHINHLSEIATLIETLSRLRQVAIPKIAHAITLLVNWLRAQMLALDRWLSARCTRAYQFILSTKKRDKFENSAPFDEEDRKYRRRAIDPEAVNLPYFRNDWLKQLLRHEAYRNAHHIPLLQDAYTDERHWHVGLMTTYDQLGVLLPPTKEDAMNGKT